MRIAVCISGGMKNHTNSLLSISKIFPGNVEVFIHTWSNCNDTNYLSNSNSPNISENPYEVIEKYKCSRYIIEDFSEKEKKFWQLYDGFQSYVRSDVGSISMFYSIHMCNEIKKQYELENNFKFDRVIRMRFDSNFFPDQLDLSDEKFGGLCIPEGRDWLGGMNDQFAVGSSELMDVYSDVYNNLDSLKCHKYHAETLLREHLNKSDLHISRFFYQVNINNQSSPDALYD